MAADPEAAQDFFVGDFEEVHVNGGRSTVEDERDDDDEVVRGLLRAISCYRQGQFKGAVRNAANAINEIVTSHQINGGAWF